MSEKVIREIHYTICPVGNSSYIAAKKGWLKDALEPLGAAPVLLQSLPQERWKAHFDYRDDALFREGGNIPPLWARSNGAEVTLIGLALLKQKQYILAGADSEIETIEQLRGRKIAIPAHPNALIDFHRASAEHGFRLALNARGVSWSEVEPVVIKSEGDFLIGRRFVSDTSEADEVAALDRGEVDAVYVKLSKLRGLLNTGKYKVLFDIGADPSSLSPINNEYPNALTVSTRLANEYPEVVVAYVKQLLLASIWAKSHRAEAVEILAEQTLGSVGEFIGSNSDDFHKNITPNLSDESLEALEGQKKFLYDSGYIEKDFALESWADDSFLKAAWREIKDDDEKGVRDLVA
ncbi:MAG: ABC transporter substrate-binding protein [Synergistaceae bacterium]|jgi:2'-hydroxybiphenyl-2-sulfinate desulfinase|nr:ABC transporter substrate-binding protein [Synergistaceae bacterium]